VLLAAALLVNSVSVPGTGLHVKLATQVGRLYDERAIEKDVRWLWSLGRFDDVRVEEPAPGDLVFRVKPRPRLVLRDARLMPHSFGIELGLKPGTPIDPVSAREIARGFERQLGYPVEESLIPRGNGRVDLRLQVKPDKKRKREQPPVEGIRYAVSKSVCRELFRDRAGALEFVAKFDVDAGLTGVRGLPYRVGRIEFQGNHRIPDAKIRRRMLLDEGGPFDERRLRRSLARLQLDQRNVVVARDPVAGVAHITLLLPERKRGAWQIGGPWPFRASIGYGPVSLTQYGVRRIPVVSLFGLSPQLGLHGMAVRFVLSQAQRRMGRRIVGDGPVEGPLRVTGEADAVCISKPRLRFLRSAAAAALGFL
jgi:hypothetical protein